jgi:hypothetical protein
MFIFDSVLSEINIYEINFLNTVVRGMNVCRKCQEADCLSFLLTRQTILHALTHTVNKYLLRSYVHCAAKVTLFTLELEWNIVRQIVNNQV